MASLLGSSTPVVKATRASLDLVYRHNALLLKDAFTILGGSYLSIPIPILGFVYEHPSSMDLLDYSYSEFPYLTKTTLINSYQKNNTQISIRSYRAITSLNGVVSNIALNEGIFQLLEKYCDRGGTFAILTMWGYFENLVLNKLSIIPPSSGELSMGGVGFEWNFTRVNFDKSDINKVFNRSIENLTKGTVG